MGVCGSIPEVEAPKQARSEEDELRISSEAQAAAKKRLSTIKIDKDEEEKLKEYKRHKGAAEELERSVKEIEDRESLALEVARKAEEERAQKKVTEEEMNNNNNNKKKKQAEEKKNAEEEKAKVDKEADEKAKADKAEQRKAAEKTAADEVALEEARWAEREEAALSEKAEKAAATTNESRGSGGDSDGKGGDNDNAPAEEPVLPESTTTTTTTSAEVKDEDKEKRGSMRQALLAASKREKLTQGADAATKRANVAAKLAADQNLSKENQSDHYEGAVMAAAVAAEAAEAAAAAESVPAAAKKAIIGDEEPPVPRAWQIKKCARNGSFFSAVQDRWLVIGNGAINYYKVGDADISNPPSYVKIGAVVKNTISSVRGAHASYWDAQFEKESANANAAGKEKTARRSSKIGGDDSCTVQVFVPTEKHDSNNSTSDIYMR